MIFPDTPARHLPYTWIGPLGSSGISLSGSCVMSQSRADCKIVIRGSLDLSWSEYVGDMLVHACVEEGTVGTTTLIGHPIDLAAFLGTLHLLVDLGFPVMAFEYQQADTDLPQSRQED